MNYLITGSSGFIGQNLIYSLKSRSNNIVGIDIKNPEYNNGFNLLSKVDLLK